jgi:predicted metal-dependent peptidase
MSRDLQRRLSASLLRLRTQTPFFATLALFARFEWRYDFPTAATNGRDVFFNPDFAQRLNQTEFDAVFLHEVLHAALLHVVRRGEREPLLWNIAADVVINGIIANETPFTLPKNALRDSELEKFSTEEVYELLRQDARHFILAHGDLREAPPGELGEERRQLLETYWRNAHEQAALIAATHGHTPAGWEREVGALQAARLNWRAHLWRYLVRTPVDFQGFDRRFFSRGLYLETLEGESVRVFVGVDTSGSVSDEQMNQFLGEVSGILQSYPHIECDLYFCDAAAHGPFRMARGEVWPAPIGGGGTDFRPFFAEVKTNSQPSGVCVYLTDGYGTFPSEPPEAPVLWVVTPGGLALEKFPFGESVRLVD